MEPLGVESHTDVMWCQKLWDMTKDGGTWAVPRSGLVFWKDEKERVFLLIERMPWTEEMGRQSESPWTAPFTAEDLRGYQDADFEEIAKRFALIGVVLAKR